MLFSTVEEFRTGMVYPDGYEHDRSMDGLRARLAKAQKFVLDAQASAMAAGVALSKPSSIIASLAFAKLPVSPMWIEFANGDVRAAMAHLGSPNMPTPDARVVMERSGFLLTEEGDELVLEFVHQDRVPDGRSISDLAPVMARFRLRDFMSNPFIVASVLSAEAAPKLASGKVQQHLGLVHSDPDEAAADAELRQRFRWFRHPDVARVRDSLKSMTGEKSVQATEEGQARDMYRMWALQVLPALILLNCRNAVDAERVPAPEKLNKQRQKKGRPPIREHHIVKMHLSPERRKAYETANPGGRGSSRGGLVMGHFKVRKNGVYWWSPHWRGSTSDEAPSRTVILTR